MNKNQQYRVYHVPAADRKCFNEHRDDNGLTNKAVITGAVDKHLANIVEKLEELGFRPDDDRKPARWPVTDEVLAGLKLASERVGVPASQLLLLSIRAEAGAAKPARATGRGRGATTRAAKTAKTPRSPRKSSKATGSPRKAAKAA